MLAHLDLHPCGIHAIDVVWSSQFRACSARVEAILERFGKQSHRDAAGHGPNECIADVRVSDAIHRELDLLLLLIDLRNRPRGVVLGGICVGQEVQRRIDRIRRIAARQWRGNLGVVTVSDGVGP